MGSPPALPYPQSQKLLVARRNSDNELFPAKHVGEILRSTPAAPSSNGVPGVSAASSMG